LLFQLLSDHASWYRRNRLRFFQPGFKRRFGFVKSLQPGIQDREQKLSSLPVGDLFEGCRYLVAKLLQVLGLLVRLQKNE
jgi:hypothetical protein